jgi:hypothetical protein
MDCGAVHLNSDLGKEVFDFFAQVGCWPVHHLGCTEHDLGRLLRFVCGNGQIVQHGDD